MPESSVDSYINAQPEQAISFYDFYNQQGRAEHGSSWIDADPEHWAAKFGNFFTGRVDKAKHDYEAYLRNLDDRNEFLAQQSARAYDKMMDDTKYQRMMKDFEAAGLNPYLMVNNGGISASSAPSSGKADYRHGKSSNNDGLKGRNIALIILALARVAAAML